MQAAGATGPTLNEETLDSFGNTGSRDVGGKCRRIGCGQSHYDGSKKCEKKGDYYTAKTKGNSSNRRIGEEGTKKTEDTRLARASGRDEGAPNRWNRVLQ